MSTTTNAFNDHPVDNSRDSAAIDITSGHGCIETEPDAA
jgi:hypothetical protein